MGERLPRGYKWKVQTAKRRNKKRRACDGMLLEIKDNIIIEKEEISKKKRVDWNV